MMSAGLMLATMAVLAGCGIASQVPDLLMKQACKADVDKFCPDMHDPVKVMECLQGHEKEISADCASSLHRCPMYSCIDDIKKFCPDASGTKETLICLWKHRAELSDHCWNQSIPTTKLGFLPDAHACRVDEQEFCLSEESLLGTMNCLRQPKLKRTLSAPCSRMVENGRLFACVPEAQQSCPDITTIKDLKGCIMQHNLQCLAQPSKERADVDSSFQFMFCEAEAKQFCPNISPEVMYDCLRAHDDSVSKQCKKSLKSSLEHKCKEERGSFCKDKFGQELKACLNQVKFPSTKCQRVLTMPDFDSAEIYEDQLSIEIEPGRVNAVNSLNILLTCLASVGFIVILAGLTYVVRKARSASVSFDSLPSATTTTEYIRI